jgi:hypothetical protein
MRPYLEKTHHHHKKGLVGVAQAIKHLPELKKKNQT